MDLGNALVAELEPKDFDPDYDRPQWARRRYEKLF